MNPADVVYIARRYRPLPGGLENTAARLLGELVARGHRVTVLTPRRQRDWPPETVYAGVRVLRLAPAEAGCWGEFRYARKLAAALAQLCRGATAVVVSGLRADAYTALGEAKRRGFRTILQPERPGLGGDCHWQIEARGGARIKRRCYGADRFVALTPLLHRELIAAGYPRPRLREVPLGVPIVAAVSENAAGSQRLEARRSLAQADPALAATADEKLVAYVGRLRLGKGLDTLLDAWRRVAETRPDAVLWLVGEGPDAAYLRERVLELGLLGRIRLAGAFDDVDDVYRAVDACVCPTLEDGLGTGLLEAAAAGLPIVAGDTVTHRDLLTDGREALLCRKGDADDLARSLLRLIDDPVEARRLGAAARRRVAAEHSTAAMADAYASVIQEAVYGSSSCSQTRQGLGEI